MRFHWLRLRATAHATEDLSKVEEAVRTLAGLDAQAFAAATQVTAIQGHHGADVHLVETVLTRSREVRAALAPLVEALPGLAREVEARTDEDGVFYMRFDKQAASRGAVVATRTEDAVQVRIKPEVHPARRELAVAALQAWLGGGGK